MTREPDDPFEYDVAISFASAAKTVAKEFAERLTDKNIKVFLDEYTSTALWGKDVVDHLVNLYARKARYCVLLISEDYPLKKWTEAERTSAQERAFRDAKEYILPIKLEKTDNPGITEAARYQDLQQGSLESMVDLLEQKLTRSRGSSGPPSKSHDLRSGNIPSKERK